MTLLLSGLTLLIGYYIAFSLATYLYGVIKVKEFTGKYSFNIRNGYIADLIKYPKWALFWLDWIVNIFKR